MFKTIRNKIMFVV